MFIYEYKWVKPVKLLKSYFLYITCHGKEHISSKSMSDHYLWFIPRLEQKCLGSFNGKQLYLVAGFTWHVWRGQETEVTWRQMVNETKKYMIKQGKLLHIKRGALEQHWKGKLWFLQAYEFVQVLSCRSLFAKPGAFSKSWYRQQSWGKGTAWWIPHRSSQGNVMRRSRFSSSSLMLLLPALTSKVSKVHTQTPGKAWKEEQGGTGQSADTVFATCLVQWNNLSLRLSYGFRLFFSTNTLTIAATCLKEYNSNLNIWFSWHNGFTHT